MGTRSTIAIEHNDNSVSVVYCHWDGYLEHNGKLLLKNYSNYQTLSNLIEMGDLSVLGKDLDSCEFYGRDKNEDDVAPIKYTDIVEYTKELVQQEYNYILRSNGVWYVSYMYGDKIYRKLIDAIESLQEEEHV